MTATIAANGFLEIPAVFRETDAIKEGQQCDIERVGKGEYRLRVKDRDATKNGESWVDILRACPVKDWYVPLESGQTTADLKETCFE